MLLLLLYMIRPQRKHMIGQKPSRDEEGSRLTW